MNTPHHSDRRAFSLVELLVVVAILSILVSLLVPLGHLARNVSEDATCRANIAAIAKAMVAYEGANGKFPNSQYWVDKSAGRHYGGVWAEWAFEDNVSRGTLYPYVGSPEPYLCPTFARVFQKSPRHAHIPKAYVSYAMNEFFNPANPDGKGSWQHNNCYAFHGLRTQVIYPSRMGMIGEENTIVPTKWANHALNNLALGVGRWPNGKIDSLATFHNAPAGDLTAGVSNVAFFDLHVESRHPRDSLEVMTPEAIKRCMGAGYGN